ncbi:hypothetical protein COCMIDRAFT_23934 [Bipolaris oryzae ATCC 44560]|uniref:Uncharacterized protein n=1 Tax=Bipolaris oryzae ATCC 44560 TaxID=930090 RepID=W6ZEB4_COCMI|nr:uncharacterized protein COCMIDRAFT_23934 [Bipolaris oryzae ATCC 44560]EUC48213.1 hypothetical protein COCMIDRAFT_23934 [Bipolaris oryzae ATCC 44560]
MVIKDSQRFHSRVAQGLVRGVDVTGQVSQVDSIVSETLRTSRALARSVEVEGARSVGWCERALAGERRCGPAGEQPQCSWGWPCVSVAVGSRCCCCCFATVHRHTVRRRLWGRHHAATFLLPPPPPVYATILYCTILYYTIPHLHNSHTTTTIAAPSAVSHLPAVVSSLTPASYHHLILHCAPRCISPQYFLLAQLHDMRRRQARKKTAARCITKLPRATLPISRSASNPKLPSTLDPAQHFTTKPIPRVRHLETITTPALPT